MSLLKSAARRALLLVGLLALAPAATIFGQSATGQLTGSVADQSGARVAGASVTATNVETALERTAATDETGDFAITLLPPGRYRVEVSAQGFKKIIVESVTV